MYKGNSLHKLDQLKKYQLTTLFPYFYIHLQTTTFM